MNLPSGLLNQATPIIAQIAASKGASSAFAYFQPADIEQEVWVICIKALPQYMPSRGPLDHYLKRCVNNRLKNLKRDRYFRPSSNTGEKSRNVQDRINIVNAIALFAGNDKDTQIDVHDSSSSNSPSFNLEYEELIDRLKKDLPESVLYEFLILLQGGQLPKNKMDKVRSVVVKLLASYHE